MKSLFKVSTSIKLILIFLATINYCIAEQLTMSDLVKKDGFRKSVGFKNGEYHRNLYYRKSTGVLYTGPVTYEGEIAGKITGWFYEGLREGTWEYYYKNSNQLKSRETFKDGKLDGRWLSYYESGQLKWTGVFTKGVRDGLFEDFDKNGNKIKERLFIKGETQ